MPFSIKNDETDRLARELSAATGESLTEAVTEAVRERLERQRARGRNDVRRLLQRLADEVSELDVVDGRDPDEIIDYDGRGAPR